MTNDDIKAIVRRALEGIWRNDAATFAAHPGFADTRQVVPLVLAAFPDAALSVQRQISEGDTVATLCLVRGTHRGSFMGIPPTGKPFQCQFLAINRVVDGKVVEHNSEMGWLSALRQLGVLPIVPPPSVSSSRTEHIAGESGTGKTAQ